MLWFFRVMVVASIAAGGVVLVGTVREFGIASDQAASWAQAVASVAAIWAAAEISLLVPALERRNRAIANLIGLRNLAAVVQRYVAEVQDSKDGELPGRSQARYRRRRDLCIQAVEVFPLAQIEPGSLVSNFAEIKLHNNRFWEEVMQDWPETEADQQDVIRRAKESREEIDLHMTILDRVLRSKGVQFANGIAFAERFGVPRAARPA